jgi:hypothetical protein
VNWVQKQPKTEFIWQGAELPVNSLRIGPLEYQSAGSGWHRNVIWSERNDAAAGLGAVKREEFFSANCKGLASDLEAGGNRTAISRSVSRLSRIGVLLRLWQHHYLRDHTQIVMQNAFVVVCARLREGDSEMRRIECYRVVRI